VATKLVVKINIRGFPVEGVIARRACSVDFVEINNSNERPALGILCVFFDSFSARGVDDEVIFLSLVMELNGLKIEQLALSS
jgi:hypothetical protein